MGFLSKTIGHQPVILHGTRQLWLTLWEGEKIGRRITLRWWWRPEEGADFAPAKDKVTIRPAEVFALAEALLNLYQRGQKERLVDHAVVGAREETAAVQQDDASASASASASDGDGTGGRSR